MKSQTPSAGLTVGAAASVLSVRYLNIHEYLSHDLMRKHGINVPKSGHARTPEEAVDVAKKLGGEDVVVKAQILAGGRGLGTFTSGLKGGVHMCASLDDVQQVASMMLGKTLVTKQTGPEGQLVSNIFVVERRYLRREAYLAFLMDRASAGPVMVGSAKGGMDIEGVAAETPEAIVKIPISIKEGLTREQAITMAKALDFSPKVLEATADEITKLYNLFISADCTQVEINPFVETNDHEVMCMDAKLNFDDNAEYRQPEVFALRDASQEDSREVAASQYNLNYIGLDGTIGCMVNGAGLAMATMDIIQLHGGSPANFLDVGGGATAKQIEEAFKILTSDDHVMALFVNIFGGIMRCDIVAQGIIDASKSLALEIPLVVRLEGTNVNEAKEMIANSGVNIVFAEELEAGAEKVVKMASIVESARKLGVKVNFEW